MYILTRRTPRRAEQLQACTNRLHLRDQLGHVTAWIQKVEAFQLRVWIRHVVVGVYIRRQVGRSYAVTHQVEVDAVDWIEERRHQSGLFLGVECFEGGYC